MGEDSVRVRANYRGLRAALWRVLLPAPGISSPWGSAPSSQLSDSALWTLGSRLMFN
jgi:hypothetical protein